MKTLRAILFYFWQFTFAIIQNIIGLAVFIAYKIKGAESEIYHCAVITRVDRKNFGGVSIGIFIFINKDVSGDKLHDMKIHEYGHTVQSMILGPLWLAVIALPSVVWNRLPFFAKRRREKNVSYYKPYCEGWANLCGLWATKERFLTDELINRGRYGGPISPNRSKRKDLKGRKRKR